MHVGGRRAVGKREAVSYREKKGRKGIKREKEKRDQGTRTSEIEERRRGSERERGRGGERVMKSLGIKLCNMNISIVIITAAAEESSRKQAIIGMSRVTRT